MPYTTFELDQFLTVTPSSQAMLIVRSHARAATRAARSQPVRRAEPRAATGLPTWKWPPGHTRAQREHHAKNAGDRLDGESHITTPSFPFRANGVAKKYKNTFNQNNRNIITMMQRHGTMQVRRPQSGKRRILRDVSSPSSSSSLTDWNG